MPLFGRAELYQRQRLFVVALERGVLSEPSALFESLEGMTIREVQMAKLLADIWRPQLIDGARLRDVNISLGLRRILEARGVTLLWDAEPLLATIPDVELDLFWKRILSETIDVAGFGIVLLPESSSFLPSPHLAGRYSHQIRRLAAQQ